MITPACAKIETITPEIAAKWLTTNSENQRSVTKTHKDHLAKEMAGGNWILTGETIIFDWFDRLIEGQHRLYAVIDSKTTIRSWVIYGVDPKAFAYINRGKIRTTANIYQIAGIKESTTIASITNNVWRYRRALRIGGSINTYERAAPHELMDIYNESPKMFFDSASISNLAAREIGLAKSIGGSIHFLAMEACGDADLVELFFAGLAHGKGLNDGDPILYFRNLLIRSSKSQMKINSYQSFAIGAKAWNLFRHGKTARVIRFQDGEPFPRFE